MNNYRIKTLHLIEGMAPAFAVQMRFIFGLWITIKMFHEVEDWPYAKMQAEELYDKLTEH